MTRIMKKLFFLFIVLVNAIPAQSGEWFPSGLTVQPFAANFLEPRMGFMFETNKNDIRLEIGSSMDFYRSGESDGSRFSFGADFYTFTLLRGEKDFHFPVDAVDYLFGVNGSYIKTDGKKSYGARVRFSHISAHFVDGHYDGTNGVWKNNRNPIVYSREFIEALAFYSLDNLRFYGGMTYIVHLDPTTIGKDIYQAGFDYYHGKIFGMAIYPFAAYDLRIANIDGYTANHTVMAGLKFGKMHSNGFRIYVEYYNGNNVHGEYYSDKNEFTAIGFNLEF